MPDINATLPAGYLGMLPTQAGMRAQDEQISANLLHGLEAAQRSQQMGQQAYQFERTQGLAEQQFALQQRQQQALLPIQAQHLQNEVQLQALAIQHGLQAQQDDVETAQAVVKLSDYLQGAFRVGNAGDPIVQAGMLNILKRYPRAGDSPAMQTVWQSLQRYQAYDQAEQLARLKITPPAPIQEAADYDTTRRAYEAAIASGDTAKATELGKVLEVKRAKYFPTESMKLQDAAGNLMFEVQKGGGPGGVMPGTATTAQKNIIQSQKSIDLINQVESSLDPSSVGPVAFVQQNLINELGAAFVPDWYDKKLGSDQEKLKVLRETLIRQISSDPRFSNADRARAESAAPSVGAKESYPNAMTKLEILKDIFTQRARIDAENAGMQPPDFTLSVKEIGTLLKNKKITAPRAIELMRRYHPEATNK